MNRPNLLGTVACTSFLITAALAFPGAASSAVKRLTPSSACHPEWSITSTIGDTTVDTVRRVGSQLRVEWGNRTVVCGYPSDGSLLHNQVDDLKVRGYRGNSGDFLDAGARACVGSFLGTAHCGSSSNFGDGGYFTVFVDDLDKWANSHWYPYLSITMRRGDRLYGIVASN